ncbi:MAG: type III secretion system gatekeeper subunit SctW [Chlamydiae bacterium]|nr:type III secretion system gatekeeper subunit SctW [Chlamydiota bacterium]
MPRDVSPIEPIEPSETRKIQEQEQIEKRLSLAQETAKYEFDDWRDEALFSAPRIMRNSRTLDEQRRKVRHDEARKEEEISQVENVEEISEQYSKKNRELDATILRRLRLRISKEDTPQVILRKVLEDFSDYSLADEVLDFIIDTTTADLAEKARQAKEDLQSSHGREVRAGRNIETQAREYSDKGLGTPSALRDLYREITGNPREASILFSEMSGKFQFGNMKLVIGFLLHSLGADLKSKGPSISRAELHRLMSEGRNLQAILWVYRFFLSRMKLIEGAFTRSGLSLSSDLTFELLAKQFVQFLLERYPTMDKVLQLALKLGISAKLLAQIIIFTQMRDAVRGVAGRLFKSEQHRQDVLLSFIEALEELEERFEEEEEKEEEKKKKKKDR